MRGVAAQNGPVFTSGADQEQKLSVCSVKMRNAGSWSLVSNVRHSKKTRAWKPLEQRSRRWPSSFQVAYRAIVVYPQRLSQCRRCRQRNPWMHSVSGYKKRCELKKLKQLDYGSILRASKRLCAKSGRSCHPRRQKKHAKLRIRPNTVG